MKKYIFIVLFVLASILSLLGSDFKLNFSVILNICMGALWSYLLLSKGEKRGK